MFIDLFIESQGGLKMDKKAREVLYIGIVADIGRFVFLSNTT